MAVLPDTDRKNLWAKFMSDTSSRREPLPGILKHEVRDAINTVDDRIGTFLSGLNVPPVSALSKLSANQQLELVSENIKKRREI